MFVLKMMFKMGISLCRVFLTMWFKNRPQGFSCLSNHSSNGGQTQKAFSLETQTVTIKFGHVQNISVLCFSKKKRVFFQAPTECNLAKDKGMAFASVLNWSLFCGLERCGLFASYTL